jgi:hypothetical protein
VLNPLPRTVLGAAVGVIGLIGMIRLVAAGFPGDTVVAVIVVGLAMVPWVIYAGWRARHGRLSLPAALAVAFLVIIGLALVWWGTFGPVLAMVASLAGFVIIWAHDLPQRRRPAKKLVRIDQLTDSED